MESEKQTHQLTFHPVTAPTMAWQSGPQVTSNRPKLRTSQRHSSAIKALSLSLCIIFDGYTARNWRLTCFLFALPLGKMHRNTSSTKDTPWLRAGFNFSSATTSSGSSRWHSQRFKACSSSVSIGAARHWIPSTGTQNMRNTDCSKRWLAFILEHWMTLT